MGNCCPEPHRQPHRHPISPPRVPSPPLPPTGIVKAKSNKAASKPDPTVDPTEDPPVRLYGPEACPLTLRLQLTLLYKGISPQFIPRESPILPGPLLRFGGLGGDVISGSEQELLECIDKKFTTEPNGVVSRLEPAEEVVLAVELQHRSMERHLEGISRAVKEMSAAGKKGKKTGAAAEGRRISRWYGELVEVMLEHARMEESLLFPVLERAAYKGVCKVANKQHAGDLPMLNGIKEFIKSLLSFEAGTSLYQEALLNLSQRLKNLQEHCKEHFREEEKELFPLIDSVYRMQRIEGDISNWSNSGWVGQVVSATELTHSRLFPFFIAGLLPQEAMEYVDLICRSTRDPQQLASMLQSLTSLLEGTCQSSFIFDSLLRK
ncbi:Hemerythrin HHE cation binding domain-containing protein [Carex littledalei]|uniref:Hemerythrin HHE cation binding domain-containing protein n=1 Tax=Carex littledalei TaxID=544730 RepID=A0A833QT17_9POAL|nr:Hemerythrin HHE cation binding domain-containing protein [Carex littledalei]